MYENAPVILLRSDNYNYDSKIHYYKTDGGVYIPATQHLSSTPNHIQQGTVWQEHLILYS